MKKKRIVIGSVIAIAGVLSVGAFTMVHSSKKQTAAETISKETKVSKGDLVVGVTESGSVTIGTVSQEFELEPVSVSVSSGSSSTSGSSSSGSSSSSKSSGSSSSSNSAAPGGSETGSSSGTKNMSMTSTSGATSSTASSGSSTSSNGTALEVEEVKVATGQVVKEGDAILTVTKKSLAAYKKELEEAVSTAELALKKAKLEREQTKVSAEYEYKSNKKLGSTAKAEYNATINKLAKAVSDAQTAISNADSQLSELSSKIKTAKNTLSDYKSQAKNAKDSAKKAQIEQKVTATEQQIESLQSQYDLIKNNYSTLTANLSAAKRKQTTDSITAKQEYETNQLTYNNADSLYQIAMNGIDTEVTAAQETLNDAKQVLADFKEYVGDGTIKATVSGTVMSIGYSEGEELSTSTPIVTYSNAKNMTMSVSVSQEDISVVTIGDTVQVEFTAYEGETYEATVSKIETAKNNSSTVSYNVTVTLSGDMSKIYTGMTGNVTFVTKQVKDVVQVSNKAIKVEGTTSYVVKVENGVRTKTEVQTGFSDGINVEIVSGLKEGDTVLIESQVNGA